jgi:hypothetical protein
MLRGLLRFSFVCLVLMLMLAPASQARQHLVSLNRNEIALYYQGHAFARTPTGYYQHGSENVAIGENRFYFRWHAFAIVLKAGVVVEHESSLTARGHIYQDPNVGNPEPSLSTGGKPCHSVTHVVNRFYSDGVSAFPFARSLGIRLTLPADARWIATPPDAMRTNCYVQTDDSPGTLVGAGAVGPQSGRRERALQRALYPQLTIPIAGPSESKLFDFQYGERLSNLDGPYAFVDIEIESSVDAIVGCEQFDTTNGRCVKRYG